MTVEPAIDEISASIPQQRRMPADYVAIFESKKMPRSHIEKDCVKAKVKIELMTPVTKLLWNDTLFRSYSLHPSKFGEKTAQIELPSIKISNSNIDNLPLPMAYN